MSQKKNSKGRAPRKSDNISFSDGIDEIIRHLKTKRHLLSMFYKDKHGKMSHGNFLKMRHHINQEIKFYKELKNEPEGDLEEITREYLKKWVDIRVVIKRVTNTGGGDIKNKS